MEKNENGFSKITGLIKDMTSLVGGLTSGKALLAALAAGIAIGAGLGAGAHAAFAPVHPSADCAQAHLNRSDDALAQWLKTPPKGGW